MEAFYARVMFLEKLYKIIEKYGRMDLAWSTHEYEVGWSGFIEWRMIGPRLVYTRILNFDG